MHYFCSSFFLYTYILSATCLALLKVIYGLLIPLLPSFSSSNGKSIWVSSPQRISPEDGWKRWICHPTFFPSLINWNFFHGPEPQCYLTVWIQAGLALTCQVSITLSSCHWLIWSLHWLISFKSLPIDLVKLTSWIRDGKFWVCFIWTLRGIFF